MHANNGCIRWSSYLSNVMHRHIQCIPNDCTRAFSPHAAGERASCLCRWDNSCCEAEKWHKASSAAELQHGQQQPFYQVLVDAKDWDTSWASPAVAYVAQELLNAPEVHTACMPQSASASACTAEHQSLWLAFLFSSKHVLDAWSVLELLWHYFAACSTCT